MAFQNVSVERIINYFLIQRFRGLCFLITMILIFFINSGVLTIILVLNLALKIGIPPIHMWIINILIKENFFIFLILRSVQKILPLIGLIRWGRKIVILTTIVCCAVFRALGAFNHSLVLPLLSFYSILRIGWIFLANRITLGMVYLLVYFFRTITLISCLKVDSSKWRIWNNISRSLLNLLVCIILIARLLGVPPIIGFLGKLCVMSSIFSFSERLGLIILIISNSLMIYYFIIYFGAIFIIENKCTTWSFNFYLKQRAVLFTTLRIVIFFLWM